MILFRVSFKERTGRVTYYVTAHNFMEALEKAVKTYSEDWSEQADNVASEVELEALVESKEIIK